MTITLAGLRSRALSIAAASSLLAVAACDDVTNPPRPIEGSFTVNASTGWAFVNLTDSAVVTPTPSATQSPAWDIAFFGTNVMLNGGASGPGGVSGYCICQNATASDNDVLAMTAESELADFDAVTSVPANATFESDALLPAISGWYTGTGASAVADPSKLFFVRLSDGATFAKVHVTAITGATAASAGSVTLEYAVQSALGQAFGATKTLTIASGSSIGTTPGADLQADATTTNATAWDIRLDGWNLLVNSAISGSGSAGAVLWSSTLAFAGFTGAQTTMFPHQQVLLSDSFGGVFAASPYYRYNILGDNRVSPTFDVYLVRRGNSVFKVQVLSYYSVTGASRNITFRYKRIAA